MMCADAADSEPSQPVPPSPAAANGTSPVHPPRPPALVSPDLSLLEVHRGEDEGSSTQEVVLSTPEREHTRPADNPADSDSGVPCFDGTWGSSCEESAAEDSDAATQEHLNSTHIRLVLIDRRPRNSSPEPSWKETLRHRQAEAALDAGTESGEDDEDASVEESRNREAGHEQVHGGMAPQAQSRASNAPLSPQTGLLGAGLDLNVMSWMDTINQGFGAQPSARNSTTGLTSTWANVSASVINIKNVAAGGVEAMGGGISNDLRDISAAVALAAPPSTPVLSRWAGIAEAAPLLQEASLLKKEESWARYSERDECTGVCREDAGARRRGGANGMDGEHCHRSSFVHASQDQDLEDWGEQWGSLDVFRYECVLGRRALLMSPVFSGVLQPSVVEWSEGRREGRIEVSVRDTNTSVEALVCVLDCLHQATAQGQGDVSVLHRAGLLLLHVLEDIARSCSGKLGRNAGGKTVAWKVDGLQLLAASTLLRLPVLREAVAAHIPVTASSLQRTLEHARTYASAVLQERCAEFLAEHFGSTAAAALATSTASMVASVLDATAQQTALVAYVRMLPVDCFRLMAQRKRWRVQWAYLPVPVYSMCVLKRYKSPEGNGWAAYKLYADLNGHLTFLLSAARDLASGRIVVTAIEDRSWAPVAVPARDKIASLESNALDTIFTLYDNGLECAGLANVNAALPGVRRREIGVISYSINLTGSSPRNIHCVFPRFPLAPEHETPSRSQQKEKGSGAVGDAFSDERLVGGHRVRGQGGGEHSEDGGTLAVIGSGGGPAPQGRLQWGRAEGALAKALGNTELVAQDDGLIAVRNLDPRWNESLKAHSLNFYGRVKMASKKNFILVPQNDPDDMILLFGKVSKNTYVVDFKVLAMTVARLPPQCQLLVGFMYMW